MSDGTCSYCHSPNVDASFEALIVERPLSDRMEALGRARHSLTGLQSMRTAMQADDDTWRCVTCLREIAYAATCPHAFNLMMRTIVMTGIFTGYELLCCGSDVGPQPDLRGLTGTPLIVQGE
jgi:hypothetical protein